MMVIGGGVVTADSEATVQDSELQCRNELLKVISDSDEND